MIVNNISKNYSGTYSHIFFQHHRQFRRKPDFRCLRQEACEISELEQGLRGHLAAPLLTWGRVMQCLLWKFGPSLLWKYFLGYHGVPKKSMVYHEKSDGPFLNGWFRGTPVLENWGTPVLENLHIKSHEKKTTSTKSWLSWLWQPWPEMT